MVGGDGGGGGGIEGGGLGGKMIVAAATLSVLASTPRLLASEEVTVEELRLVAVAAAASVAEPCRVMLIVTDVDVTMGDATETLCPMALESELVSALVNRADSVALALRLVPDPAGMVISKVICVVCSRRPSLSNRRPADPPIATEHPAGWPAHVLVCTAERWVAGSVPAGRSTARLDFLLMTTSAVSLAPVDALSAAAI